MSGKTNIERVRTWCDRSLSGELPTCLMVRKAIERWRSDLVFQNFHGWWKVQDGKVDFGYNGFADNENGTWMIRNGKVDFNYGGLFMTEDGVWHYIENGKVLSNCEGIIANNHGAWYVKNGTVQFGFTGTYHGYAIQNGKVAGKAA